MATPQAISVAISPGELLDKLSILEIKSERFLDAAKLRNIRAELAALTVARDQSIPPSEEISTLVRELKQVNEAIWDAEDFRHNDRRSAIKRQINERLAAQFVEEKQHPAYE